MIWDSLASLEASWGVMVVPALATVLPSLLVTSSLIIRPTSSPDLLSSSAMTLR